MKVSLAYIYIQKDHSIKLTNTKTHFNAFTKLSEGITLNSITPQHTQQYCFVLWRILSSTLRYSSSHYHNHDKQVTNEEGNNKYFIKLSVREHSVSTDTLGLIQMHPYTCSVINASCTPFFLVQIHPLYLFSYQRILHTFQRTNSIKIYGKMHCNVTRELHSVLSTFNC